MPTLKGTFTADFSSFNDAVEKAQVQLQAFEASSNKVEGSLSRMVNQFSGTKIVAEATLMAEAVERIGGVSKLTADELARVGKVAQEAVDKLHAMGGDAPSKIQAIADAAKGATSENKTWSESFVALGSSMFGQVTMANLFTSAVEAIGKALVDAGKAAAQFLIDVTLQGGKVADVADNFDHLTTNAGRLGATLMGELRSGTQGMVTDFDLMKGANTLLVSGMKLTDEQFGTLAKGALALSAATGTDLTTAYDTMIRAMVDGNGKSLQAIGVRAKASEMEDAFAKSLNTSREGLTDEGLLQGRRVGVLNEVTEATERLGAQTVNVAGHVDQAKTAWTNFANDLGAAINKSDALGVAFDGLGKIIVEAFGGTKEDAIKTIVHWIEQATVSVLHFGTSAVAVAGEFYKAWLDLEKLLGDVAQAFDYVALAQAKAYELGVKIRSYTAGLFDPTINAQLKEAADEVAVVNARMAERSQFLDGIPAKQAAADAATLHVTQRFAELAEQVGAAATASDKQTTATGKAGEAHKGTAAAVDAHGAALTKLTPAQEKYAADLAGLLSVGQNYQATLDTIDGRVVEAIKHYIDQGVSLEKLANVYKLTAEQVKAVQLAHKDETDALKLEQQAIEEAQKHWTAYYEMIEARGATATDAQIAQVSKWYDDTVAKLQAAGKYNAETADAVYFEWKAKMEGITVDWAAISKSNTEDSKAGLQQIADKAQATYQEALKHVGEWSDGAIQKYKETADAAQIAADTFGTGFEQAADKATGAIEKTKQKAEEAKKAIETTFSFTGGSATPVGNYGALSTEQMMSMGLVDMYHQLTARGAQAGYGYGPLGGGTSFSGFRAEGGPVSAGQTYMVGERGPELFVPTTSGSIVNKDQISNTFNIVDTESGIARRVSEHLMRSLMVGRRLSA
jgi:hypothetical protein